MHRSVVLWTACTLIYIAIAASCGDEGNGSSGKPDGSSYSGSGGNLAGGSGGNAGAGGSGGKADAGGAGTGGAAVGKGGGGAGTGGGNADAGGNAGTGGGTGGSGGAGGATVTPADGVPVGNPDGHCDIPAEAQAEDISTPDQVVGTGTAASCTGKAFVDAVAQGGKIVFDCGPDPVIITLAETAKIFNDRASKTIIDGGGKVTLSGRGKVRILYQNTCDQNQVWTTPHCDNQETPQLVVQNLTFIDGNAKGAEPEGSGGAIYASGGRFKAINSRFFNNVCDDVGPDVGGAAIRTFEQYNSLPVYIVNCTFGGKDGFGNVCSNGGGVSSIGVSWTIINSLFSYNKAIGNGGNPAESGTPGGGSGGAIYNDGNTMTLSLCGTRIEYNQVNAYGSAIFFVSNDHTGDIRIEDSVITKNIGGSWYPTYPQISNHDDTPIVVVNSTITP